MSTAKTPSRRSRPAARAAAPRAEREPPDRPREPDSRRALGAEGERRAARFLAGRGYRIVARNVRAGGVELDIVARRGRTWVFVEVKTRRSARAGAPEESVDAAKRRRLARGAVAWLRENRVRPGPVRFDVVACLCPADGEWRLRHWPGAFDADD